MKFSFKKIERGRERENRNKAISFFQTKTTKKNFLKEKV